MMRCAILCSVVIATLTTQTDGGPRLKLTLKRADDRSQIEVQDGTATVSLHSPFGISQAEMECLGERWPERLVLKLHLRGLESLALANGRTTIHASVSSTGGGVRVWKDQDEETLLSDDHPLMLKIVGNTNAGKATTAIPLKDGYFEVVLPQPFLQDNPKSITVKWIDFYRN
jgi:hypothetical protein